MLLQRVARGRSARSVIITGLRGVGKTVLLGSFRDAALAQSWAVVEYEAVKHDDQGFRRDIALKLRAALFELAPRAKWTDRFKRAAAALKAFTVSIDQAGQLQAGLDIDAIEGLADHHNLAMDLTDVLLALGEAAQDKQRGVVLLIDEIQFLSRSQLEDAKSYAERLFTFPTIGNLNEEDSRDALKGPAEVESVAYTAEALELAHEVTGGYPYFIQELGWAVWGVAEKSPITRADVQLAEDAYRAKLDSSFFRVRLDRATELQTAYLRAMAELGPQPQKAAEVAAVLQRESTKLGPTRAELIDMGLLYTPQHGYAAFTVPHFDQYMCRVLPEVVIPAQRTRRRR